MAIFFSFLLIRDMKITNTQNLSFKGALLTKLEKFILQSDSAEDKQYIKDVMAITDILLHSKQIGRFTANDTVEFKRKKSKNKFVYIMSYKSPDIKEDDINKKSFENIRMEGPDLYSVFNLQSIVRNIAYAVAYKKDLYESLSLFATDKEILDKSFEFTKEQSEAFPIKV